MLTSRRTEHKPSRLGWAALGVVVLLVLVASAMRGGWLSSRPANAAPPDEVTNALGMTLRRVPAGSFLMGSPAEDRRDDGSQPQHRVEITRPFYIGAHEVTQDQFFALMDMRPSHFSETGPGASVVAGLPTGNFPVDRVTWEEAVEFCGRLSDVDEEVAAGRTYRLPSEAEWEYACRAGTQTKFAWGETLTRAQANITGPPSGPAPLGRTAEVGSYAPNAWGIFDMHGNVWEWCADGKREYAARVEKDPNGDVSFYSCLRGGAWDYPADHCRSDHRGEALSGYVYFGFRVVCEVSPESGGP